MLYTTIIAMQKYMNMGNNWKEIKKMKIFVVLGSV